MFLRLALALAVLLLLPSLWSGLVLTDYYHKLLLTGASPLPPPHDYSLFGMFSFASGNPARIRQVVDLGVLPWWSSLDVEVSFFRPLTELTHWIDYRLWPNHPALMHAQSLLWYLGDILVVSLFLRRIFRQKSPAVAGLATLLFAVCGAHAVAVAWLSCRNALVATFFGVLVLYLHDRWREERRPQLLILSLLSLVTALLSAEYGISCIPFLVSYALFLERGRLRGRVLSVVPALVVTVIYLVFYVKSGFGARHSELYISPSNPVAYIHAIVTRLPEMLGADFSGLTVYLLKVLKGRELLVNMLFVLLALPVVPIIFRSREARFLLIGVLGALVPVSSVVLSDRVLLFSSIGVMPILAEALIYWHQRFREAATRSAERVLAGASLFALVLSHFVLSPLHYVPLYVIAYKLQNEVLLHPVASIQEQPGISGKTAVLVNPGPLMPTCYYMPLMLTNQAPAPRNLLALAPGNEPVTVTRVDERTLRVTPQSGYMVGAISWFAHPHDEAFRVGETFQLRDVTVTVESLDEQGGPRTALFRFHRPLDDGNLVWLHFRTPEADSHGGTYSPWHLPDVGQTVVLKKFG